MSGHVLRFRSDPKNAGLTAPSNPHQERISSWLISESLVPHSIEDLRDKGIGEYRVSMECPVDSQADVWDGLTAAHRLADEIDVAWCCAWGKPYFRSKLTFVSSEAPNGWSGNLREVEIAIQKENGSGYMVACDMFQSDWQWWWCLPLKWTLDVRRKLLTAPAVLKELISLHVRAHKSADEKLLYLAKALEIVGAFFRSDGSRASRNGGVELEMQKIGIAPEFTQPIAWLFEIANTRFDVRHAWDRDSPGVALHPKMSDQERSDFTYNADLVIRAFVCARLDIALYLIKVKHGEPPSHGRWNEGSLEFESSACAH